MKRKLDALRARLDAIEKQINEVKAIRHQVKHGLKTNKQRPTDKPDKRQS